MRLGLAPAVGVFIFLSALLHSAVGHGGGRVPGRHGVVRHLPGRDAASGLVFNIAVASFGSWTYLRRGALSWTTLCPFALTAIPLAFIGGAGPGSRTDVQTAAGSNPALLRVLPPVADVDTRRRCSPEPTVAANPRSGAVIGLLSGLTGIGGGIFLSPLLLLNRWSMTQKASGVASVFLLLNSVAGLAGQASTVTAIPWVAIVTWLPMALVRGFLGSRHGSRTHRTKNLCQLPGLVLIIAALKLLLTITT